MAFCSSCGEKLSPEDNFCPNCGLRTKKGQEAGITTPEEEIKQAFTKIGQEMEKAFTIATKEIQKAFKTARENIEKTPTKKPITCSNCGQENPRDSSFCYKCGKKLD